LADDSVHTRVSKRNFQYIAFDDVGSFLKSDALGQALIAALEKAGVEFIAENGGGAGVRLAKRARKSK
jgi:hypothetical protein